MNLPYFNKLSIVIDPIEAHTFSLWKLTLFVIQWIFKICHLFNEYSKLPLIFSIQLKLCLTAAIHNFKYIKICYFVHKRDIDVIRDDQFFVSIFFRLLKLSEHDFQFQMTKNIFIYEK